MKQKLFLIICFISGITVHSQTCKCLNEGFSRQQSVIDSLSVDDSLIFNIPFKFEEKYVNTGSGGFKLEIKIEESIYLSLSASPSPAEKFDSISLVAVAPEHYLKKNKLLGYNYCVMGNRKYQIVYRTQYVYEHSSKNYYHKIKYIYYTDLRVQVRNQMYYLCLSYASNQNKNLVYNRYLLSFIHSNWTNLGFAPAM